MTPPFPRRATTVLHISATIDAVDAVLNLLDEAQASPATASTPRPEGPVILIDGRSGSGKTDFSNALAEALTERWHSPVTLVHLDDIYPGWSGLESASRHVHDSLLSPCANSTSDHPAAPGWRRHDWATGHAAEWVTVDPSLPLLVEGTGSLSRQNAALATLTVWVELDDATRRDRALARDGETYEPYWEMWAEQENDFIAREGPRSLADVVIDLTRSTA
ncbi:nucleoside/nucleotide kinase family protein [Subtercola frigoramans]|uniref:Uridine kinase n=1 Tax=Subtercola frigoramans TaxID=120298 RepID=A0ABS2L351_9MICO|nr:ATP-binding protein [Subtercola frigoramans]MBM7471525.1 uridine kinase [Subtercola frigoramans]